MKEKGTYSVPSPSKSNSRGTKKLSSCDLHLHGALTCSLHGCGALVATWPMVMQLHTQSPGGSLNGLQLETHAKLAECWAGLYLNMEHKLWSGLRPAPTEDKIGLFLWRDNRHEILRVTGRTP